ncbi:MAG: 4-hydroxythreonine-4-phosphate dehydrogenase PdxA, partial [Bdellovibrionales bacterium]|nr:4-hydroxythreonine-4-phosphate dehydrogenase PdxA [Bdellovibrionales bacterium]
NNTPTTKQQTGKLNYFGYTQVLITTGDTNGIGLEISLKALHQLKPKKNVQFVLITSKKNKVPKHLGKFITSQVKNLKEVTSLNSSQNIIPLLKLSSPPRAWVEKAAQYCLEDPSHRCLVTAPMSKSSFGEGHTEILKRVSKQPQLKMGFIGKHFNLVLGTTHIPLDRVASSLSKKLVAESLDAALFLNSLCHSLHEIKILGLNPHNGEGGAISSFDKKLFAWIQSHARSRNHVFSTKPFVVPDTAFIDVKKNTTYLAWYHDQGLIPFKMAHGFSQGFQVTLGLPFIRTSVDHGTAHDIFGKGIADHNSLFLAITSAIQLTKKYGNTIFNT